MSEGINKSATAPSTPKVQRGSNRNSLFFSQLRSASRMEIIRLPQYELSKVTRRLSQGMGDVRDQASERSRPVTPNRRIIRQSMTPTRARRQSIEVLNRRRRRSSMIRKESGEIVYAQDYRGPITMDYLRYVCTVLNQEQQKQREMNERLSLDKNDVAGNEQDMIQLPVTNDDLKGHIPVLSPETHPQNIYFDKNAYSEKNISPLRTTVDLEIKDSRSATGSPPGAFDQSLPIPDVNDHFKSPILQPKDGIEFEIEPEDIDDNVLEEENVDEDRHEEMPIIEIENVVQLSAKPIKQLSYLERILNLNNANKSNSESISAFSRLETINPRSNVKRKLDHTFEIENRADFTTVDTDWGKSSISNLVDASPRINQILGEDLIESKPIIPSINESVETTVQDDNQMTTSSENIGNSPIASHETNELGNTAMDISPTRSDLENEAIHLQVDDFSEPNKEESQLDLNTLATPDGRLQEVENSDDTSIHDTEKNRDVTNSGTDEPELQESHLDSPPPSDLVNTEHSDLRTPEFSNLSDINFNNTTSPNHNIDELKTPQITENNITGDATTPPRSTKSRSGSPSGVIDEQYTLDNDQFAIFSEGSDSEDRDEFEDQDTLKPANIPSDGYTSQLSRISLADRRGNKKTGNVSLSFPTFKNLVKYVDIVNIESISPARKKKKLARPSSDIYKLLWEKSDEFLSNLVSDLDAYAQHRSRGGEYQINAQDVILYLNKLNFKNEANQRVSQVYDISKLATNFLPLELLRSLDQNLQSIKPPPLRDGSDDEDE